MDHSKQVYSGQNAIKSYLDPHSHQNLPLVELPEGLNSFLHKGVHIYAKMMNFLPLGNVKSIPAYEMLRQANTSGVEELIEASSGNTVLSLAIIGRSMGVKRTRALVSREVSGGKLMLLRLCGVDVEIVDEPICPDPGDPNGAIFQAAHRGKTDGKLNAGQYSNLLNPESHKSYTAPQIFEQLDGKVDYFCAGLGTTGTLVGASNFFKSKNPNIVTIGVSRKPNNDVPGVRTTNLLAEVDFDWKSICDKLHEVGQHESYQFSLQLIRSGLFAGPSSGFALAGLIKELEIAEKNGDLDKMQELNAVFICPDSPMPYLESYFKVLGNEEFPEIENSHLLYDNRPSAADTDDVVVNEITINDYLSSYASLDGDVLVNRRPHTLIDVREEKEYEDHHISGSINIPLSKLESEDVRLPDQEPYIFVCRSGNRSAKACAMLAGEGASSINLVGGTTEWSSMGLPRVTPDSCSR